jgi:2-polyprenyl-3-methyl-5-hydroxy-6-metoxy-1,4-benzoquinol methylase
MTKETFSNPTVLEFYKSLPFNYQSSVAEQVRSIRKRNSITNYPFLPPLLNSKTSVLEVGCGTGWLSNSINFYYQSNVTGIDFNPVAIERSQEVAKAMNLKTTFEVRDLFLYQPETPFDVVISLGVLHHTNNCQAAIEHLCRHCVSSGGHLIIGLYHQYGRKPFLDHFQEMQAKGAPETELFDRYRQLHSQMKDETQLLSWFRDQVLHPHETQHTLAEILPILAATGIELVTTSINNFQPIESIDRLLEEEVKYTEIAHQKLQQNIYFPGFFLFAARK